MVGVPFQTVSENPDRCAQTKRVVNLPICPELFVIFMQIAYLKVLDFFGFRSLATYDDILAYFNSKSLKKTVKPKTKLSDIMHKRVFTCQPMDNIDELKGSVAMKKVNALPVLNHENVLVGVVSKADLNLDGSEVQDVMSTPPVAAKANDTVTMAACLMIKHEIHHIPIVDDKNKCIGIVTSSDIFSALAEDSGDQEIMNIDM